MAPVAARALRAAGGMIFQADGIDPVAEKQMLTPDGLLCLPRIDGDAIVWFVARR
jgi:hypothetical protein